MTRGRDRVLGQFDLPLLTRFGRCATATGCLEAVVQAAPPRRRPVAESCFALDAPPRDPKRTGLLTSPKVHRARPAVAVLFRSAADVYGSRIIGVVLTGGDGDGTDGLRPIQAAGGISVVQEPGEAASPGMPMSASRCGNPDHRVDLCEMAALLTCLVRRDGRRAPP